MASSSSDQVIELSVEETNKLRAELGLKPLRFNKQTTPTSSREQPTAASVINSNNEVLELSIDETNALREKLGLKPLRTTSASVDAVAGRSASTAIHKPASGASDEQDEVQKRLEKAKLAREVREGIQNTFSAKGLGENDEEDGGGLDSWAKRMRSTGDATSKGQKKKSKTKKKSADATTAPPATYSSKDLDGIHVSHAASEFEAGSTTILTLADTELLEKKDPQSAKVIGLQDGTSMELENVNLTEAQQTSDALRRKRQLEMGTGHAGGYAGHDDEEFEEHMGVLGPSSANRDGIGAVSGPDKQAKKRGFTIGGASSGGEVDGGGSASKRVAISLEPTIVDTMASDTMTQAEYEATLEKKRQKDSKFKSKKSKKKKKKKTSRRSTAADDDDADDGGTLLAELTATATTTSSGKRRRRRSDSEEKDANMETETTHTPSLSQKRSRYEETVERANQRSKAMFAPTKPAVLVATTEEDEEPDDDFLQEALAKARRLQKLRRQPFAADAVAEALQKKEVPDSKEGNDSKGVLFQLDETREFTRALRAREEQEERRKIKKQQQKDQKDGRVADEEKQDKQQHAEMQDADEGSKEDIAELAKQIKNNDDDIEDEDTALEGTTASTVAIGRGMAGVLGMLRQTGDISNNRPKEEMRGRAKDERTYEDYETLDLEKVVRIGPKATAKDREMASREISLEYRDEHGRLLTRKEAYRNLCYHFHGHGSGKTNQERRLKQIQREQAERRLANSQATSDRSVLGALKATQKATGKAFVVHKTGH